MQIWMIVAAILTFGMMPVTGGEEAQAPEDNPIRGAHLRVARPTDNIEALMRFYRDGLGFEEIGRFVDHEGFDGVMLGFKGTGYHLEFTHHRGHKVGKAPSKDNLLVFYVKGREAWEMAVGRMLDHGFQPVPSYNPYWDKSGKTFEDPGGYRIVIQRQ